MWFHLHKVAGIVKFIKPESRMVVAMGVGLTKWWVKVLMGTAFQFEMIRNLLRLMVLMVGQGYKCTYYHWVVHLKMVKMVNFVVYIYFFRIKRDFPKNFGVKPKLQNIYLFSRAPLLTKLNSNDLSWQKGPLVGPQPSILGIAFLLAQNHSMIPRQAPDSHNSKILFRLLLLLLALSAWALKCLLNLQCPASSQATSPNLSFPALWPLDLGRRAVSVSAP